ncbi:DUF3396 domain-containing protein [Stigmatella sp. ncwal1]|uniref:DUF3396 domain-containing protein n=2 Tax=Stigmatella ashevillensis TaxID=2995309 RepID=A0ABT5D9Z3_9BACT|nr:type VI immunity family protein [Stigmatella ashevillena]MDC0709066.1 DUF3396 domain-containing protein [Stigmatella ashevillena]
MQELNEKSWQEIRENLLSDQGALVDLKDGPGGVGEFQFEYQGGQLDEPPHTEMRGPVCAVSFWLSTEYLETHGPVHVRDLALALADPLPFNSGLPGVSREIRRWCFRYPGLDIIDLGPLSAELGTQVRGAFWLTFLGQPVLGKLGGPAGVRNRLNSSDIAVQAMDGDRAILTLGDSPTAGDTEQGGLPSHRELARILEPWLHQERVAFRDFTQEETRRWERRWLD